MQPSNYNIHQQRPVTPLFLFSSTISSNCHSSSNKLLNNNLQLHSCTLPTCPFSATAACQQLMITKISSWQTWGGFNAKDRQ